MKYGARESAQLEFKESIPRYDQIVKTVIGFANQNGGEIILGIRDSGVIVGLEEEELIHLLGSLEEAIYQAVSPPILPKLSTQRFGDKTVLVVRVSPGNSPPYYRTSEGMERGTYVRLGPSTLRANLELIDELRLRARGIYYDETPVRRAIREDLHMDAIREFLFDRKNHSKAKVSESILRGYQLISDDHGATFPTVGGLLLFGVDPQRFFSEAFIICTHFRGTSGRDVLATRDCMGTLFEQFRDACHFVEHRLYRSFQIRGKKREEELEIPEQALREVILNAIIHRNYHISGPTKIAIYDDRVEIFSPGAFPGPIDVDRLDLGVTYIRNRAIGKAFRERGLAEKLGSGLITLMESYRKRGLREPQVVEGTNYVKCILPRERASVRDGETIMTLVERSREVTVGDVMKLEQISRTSAWRRLERLVNEGILAKRGQRPHVTYVKQSS